jgi:hypothetical protein
MEALLEFLLVVGFIAALLVVALAIGDDEPAERRRALHNALIAGTPEAGRSRGVIRPVRSEPAAKAGGNAEAQPATAPDIAQPRAL